MTRTARRITVAACLAVLAAGAAITRDDRNTNDAGVTGDAERYVAYDGGPVPQRPLYEPLEALVIIGLPREFGNAFGSDDIG